MQEKQQFNNPMTIVVFAAITLVFEQAYILSTCQCCGILAQSFARTNKAPTLELWVFL